MVVYWTAFCPRNIYELSESPESSLNKKVDIGNLCAVDYTNMKLIIALDQ